MVVCSVMGEGGANSLGGGSALFGTSNHPTSTLFRDNAYIRALNQLLLHEKRAAQTYLRVKTNRPSPRRLAKVSDSHKRAAREVVRLITLNSGLPKDGGFYVVDPEVVLMRLFAVMPPAMRQKAAVQTLDLLERRIVRHYTKVLKIAPESDRPILLELQRKTASHRDTLRGHT